MVGSMDKQAENKRGETGGCPFRRLIRSLVVAADVTSDKDQVGSLETSQGNASVDVITSGWMDGHTVVNSEDYVRDSSSILSLQPWIFRKEKWEHMKDNEDNFHALSNGFHGIKKGSRPEFSSRNVGQGRSRSSCRNQRIHRYSVKPLTSYENSLVPQLYKDFEDENCIFNSPPPSATPNLRPFRITHESKIISKSSYDSSRGAPQNVLLERVQGVDSILIVVGIPPLPKFTKSKRKSRRVQHGRSDASNSQQSCKLYNSGGPLDRIQLFCLGVSVGMMFTILKKKREVDKLNDMLKHMKNLVQDLQEELEMKDLLTVKELSNRTRETSWLSNPDESKSFFKNQVLASHEPAERMEEHDKQNLSPAVENAKALSTIEAELEAELERLEQNMKASSLKQKMSTLIELDPGNEGEVVHGELKTEEGHAEAKRDSDSTSMSEMNDVNYSVSPKELSIRLHEVLESRLHERIEELERALSQTQRKVRYLETEQMSSQMAFSSSKSTSNQESPSVTEVDNALVHPLCIDLTGDAVDAYDEAYAEFMHMAETTQHTPSSTDTGGGISRDYTFEGSLVWGLEDNNVDKLLAGVNEKFEIEPTWKQGSKEYSNAVLAHLGDEQDELEDEEGKRLIQQIIEKTRKGSPVLLNAQMMLFSVDE